MMTLSSISQLVANFNAAARQKLSEKLAWIEFSELTNFFRGLTEEVRMAEFSVNLLKFVHNMHFQTGGDAHLLVQAAIIERPTLVYHESLETYLKVTKDQEVGKFFLERFYAHDSRLDGKPTKVEEWDMKRAFAVVCALAPDQRKSTAETMLAMFPEMEYAQDRGGFRGMLEKVAKEAAIIRVDSAAPKAPPIRRQANGGNVPRVPAEKFAKLEDTRESAADRAAWAEYQRNLRNGVVDESSNGLLAEKLQAELGGNDEPKKKTSGRKGKQGGKKVTEPINLNFNEDTTANEAAAAPAEQVIVHSGDGETGGAVNGHAAAIVATEPVVESPLFQ